jgi:hypothetical protein
MGTEEYKEYKEYDESVDGSGPSGAVMPRAAWSLCVPA